jgi:spore maturation protein CgeB
MRLIYLQSKTFLAREIENALRKRPDLQPAIVSLPPAIAPEASPEIFEQIRQFLPALVLSINNAGYDDAGKLSDLIASSGSYQLNWFTDDPFYEEIRYGRRRPNSRNRIDFVTEPAFLKQMRQSGMEAHFLPLATDPAFFGTDSPVDYQRDIAFVGNSGLEFMDGLISEEMAKELEKHAALINQVKNRYFGNPRMDVGTFLGAHAGELRQSSLSPDLLGFLVAWMAGYLYRRDFIVEISRRYKDRFTCFGDIYWSKFITESHVSTDACYYTNLCSYYRSTRVNLNINRIQIPTAFTQRIFDCMASRAFLLTEKRALNSEFFISSGPGQELVEFSSLQECFTLIDYYCLHNDEREKIAGAGRDKVLKYHTYDNRLQEMLDICRKAWGI